MRTFTKNNNTAMAKSTDNSSELMQDILRRAKTKGATDAMVSLNQDSGYSVDVRMGEVETLAFSEDKRVSLTVYMGHRKGNASSTDTSSAALDALVTAACDIALVSAIDPCFGLADKALIDNNYPDLDLYYPWEITPSKAIEEALRCESMALAMDKRISNSDGVNFSTHSFRTSFANSNGAIGTMQSTLHSMSCSLIAKQGATMQRDYDYTTARRAADLTDLENLAKHAVKRAIDRLGARKLKTQKVPVLFSSRVSSGLFLSFINAISGGNLYRKNTFLFDAIDQPIFPENIRVYEQPFLPRGLGSSPFDADGIPTRNNVFVEKGILRQYVLGTYSARRLGLKTTANSGGVHNLTIDPTTGGLQDLLKKMDKGLLVTELMGQGVNGLTGDYSRGATGFWVEHGEIQFPVEEITIAGNLKEMFKHIVAVGNDLNPNISTRCGSVLIEAMMIAGH